MFGVLNGSCQQLGKQAKQEWWSHICGLCLTLRDRHGQMARLTTNYDAALLSVLYEAQLPEIGERRSSVCGLRSFQRADVVAANQPGAQYAASLALLMAGTSLADHISDGDSWLKLVPHLPQTITRRWTRRAQHDAEALGFESGLITQQTARQQAVEAQPNEWSGYAEPTEQAVGAAFRHTAVLAERPENLEPLERIGRLYGRIMYLLDSYRDLQADQAKGGFNALLACFPIATMQATAQRIFNQAHAALEAAFAQLVLPQPALAQRLLIHKLRTTALMTLGVLATNQGATHTPGLFACHCGRRRSFKQRVRGCFSDCSDACCCHCCDCIGDSTCCCLANDGCQCSGCCQCNDGCCQCDDGCCSCDCN